jgi:alkanesulfonate monooxygenase SsuD/methylene tetrahydromethanopterin reductase-like flavin-dependent oxidoreductase (luciferase family)
MALKDKIAFGISLPHRSPDAIDMADVKGVAQRAEALGFRDLWVTENSLDHVNCFDPVVILTYAAAVTTKIRVGCSVVVLQIHSPLMVAHQWGCLDYVSGGRAILGALPAVRSAYRGPRQPLPRGARYHQGAVDRGQGDL